MAKSMLKAKNLYKKFWAKAVACAVLVLNNCLMMRVLEGTLEEAWSGQRPDVSFLQVFAFVVDLHMLDEQRKKLDDKN